MQNKSTVNSFVYDPIFRLQKDKTINKLTSINRLINFFFVVGLLLTPFSNISGRSSINLIRDINTPFFSKLPIISYGLPFLAIASFLIVISILGKDTILQKQVFILYVFSVTSMLISLLFSPSLYPALFRFSTQLITKIISLYIASLNNYKLELREIILRRFYMVFITSGVFLSSYFIFNTILKVYQYGTAILITERGVGMLLSLPWGASNMISAILIMPLFVCIAYYHITTNNYQKYFIIISAVLIVSAILLTLSRTTITILILALFLYSILSRSLKLLVATASFLFLSYVVIQLYIDSSFIYDLYWHRLANTEELLQGNGRVEIWQKYIQYILSNSLIPIGYYGAIYKYKFSGHNFFLTTMVEQSLWGVIIAVSIYIWAIKLAFQRYREAIPPFKNFHLAFLIGILAVFANLQFEDANFTQQFATYHWAYLGFLFVDFGVPQQIKNS